MTSRQLAEIDLALANALQIDCRAPWLRIGDVLGISATTAARRWDRLTSDGAAWVTGYPGVGVWRSSCLAALDVTCSPARLDEVGAELARHPHALNIYHTSGRSDLLVIAAVPDLTALNHYVRDQVASIDGVVDVRTYPVTRMYAEASRWRLRALDPHERRLLAPESPPHDDPRQQRLKLDDSDRALIVALGPDGRRDYVELARLVGLSRASVRRRLSRLASSGAVQFRCEIASAYTEWPILATYRATVSPHEIDDVGASMTSMPEVRFCASLSARENLIFTARLRSVSDTQRVEIWLARKLPELVVSDRAIVIRSHKRMGRVLDENGRSIGVVPLEIWRNPAAVARD